VDDKEKSGRGLQWRTGFGNSVHSVVRVRRTKKHGVSKDPGRDKTLVHEQEKGLTTIDDMQIQILKKEKVKSKR
jgi:hypothetical protein